MTPSHGFSLAFRRGRILVAAALALAVPAAAQSADPAALLLPARIVVLADQALGQVNPLVFGQNIEAGDTKDIFSSQTSTAEVQTGNGFWDDGLRRPAAPAVAAARAVGTTLLRYPGGCLVHNYDWKRTVGPPAMRPDWHFGLDEFLEVCRAIGAQPIIEVSDYSGTPQDAADLVQYLNAPATPLHPWAQKRARWGHSQPYRVRWFELGNESDHGNHAMAPHRQFTPEEYADYALRTAGAMRAVDPAIKIGIVTAAGKPVGDPWNSIVLAQASRAADFVVVHTYAVGYTGNDGAIPEARLMQACMAAGEQMAQMLPAYHALIRQCAGRDLPLAITEYNAGFVQDRPKPYRFSSGAALFSADWLRVLLQPENGIVLANYWQFLNGYWGMVQSTDGHLAEKPAFQLFRLWHQHFGSRLVAVAVDAPPIDWNGFSPAEQMAFEGSGVPSPAHGSVRRTVRRINTRNLADPSAFAFPPAAGYTGRTTEDSTTEDSTLVLDFQNASGSLYPNLATITRPAGVEPEGCTYTLSFDARFVPAPGSGPAQIGLGLMDSRGWDSTHSAMAVAVVGAQTASDWKPFTGLFDALPDAPGVILLARAEAGAARVTGRLEVRHLRVDAFSRPAFPAYAALTASASLSADGRTLYLIVFNKSLDRDITARVSLAGFRARAARCWTADGSSPAKANHAEPLIRETEEGIPVPPGPAQHVFPAYSMTALEFACAGSTAAQQKRHKPKKRGKQ